MTKTDGVTPVLPSTAIARMQSRAGVQMPYRLGSGEYRVGKFGLTDDDPWTADQSGVVGCDCAGAICYAYALSRHRLGFNRRQYDRFDILDVEDDINTNSLIGDALHSQELFTIVPRGQLLQPGDVLAYPTIMLTCIVGSPGLRSWLRHDDGTIMRWIGHCQLVKEPNGVVAGGPYTHASVLQCYGPNDRRPAIRVTDAHVMDAHDERWPKLEHRTQVLRLHPRYKLS